MPHAPVAAHDGEAALEVAPSRAEAGQEIRVLGDDLEPGSEVRIELLTATGTVALGEVRTDAGGHLMAPIRLPRELTPRVYEIRVVDASSAAVSAYLTVIAETDAESTDPDDGGAPANILPAVVVVGAIALLGAAAVALRPAARTRRR